MHWAQCPVNHIATMSAHSSSAGFSLKMNFICAVLFLTLIFPPNVLNQDRRPSTSQGQAATTAVLTTRNDKCPSDLVARKRLVCYYRIEDDFRPYDLDPCLCTHIVYSYVAVKENFAFIAGKKGDLKYLSALRNRNPSVKIIVSLRPTGTAFTLEDPKNITYPLPASNTLRHRFAKRIRDFLTRHALDGVDLDYEYFKQEDHSNNRRREYLISIIQSISSSLREESKETTKPLLTITTSRYPRHLADYYDFSELHKYIDFVNIPAFNFDQEGHSLIHPAKLHGISEMENMDAIMDLALALGLPSHQLVVGVPTFGTLYRLANSSQTTPGSASISWSANKQPITTISHSKICDVRQKANWTLVREKDLTAPYIHLHDKWIGFDDEISIKLKAKYVILRQAGGLAFFHLNEDDPSGQCGLGAYPLVQSAMSVFSKPTEHINTKPIVTPLFTNTTHSFFTSFLDVVTKHGNIERVVEEDEEGSEQILPCSHDGYLRHPEDCTRFYRCLKFSKEDTETQKFQYSCPAGLVFDETYQICNWPSWSPSCIGSGEISPSAKQNFVCSKAGYFQDPDNCENFHYCSELGKTYLQSYEFKCPFELGFNEEKLQCNWKWLVKGCEYIPPEERIVKDLQQILPQATAPDFSDTLDIVPAASDVSELFEHMNEEMVEGEPEDETRDEFEERSDDGDELQGRDFTSRLSALPFLRNINKLTSAEGQPGNSRLQQLGTYMTKLAGQVRNRLWPASTLEGRSDRLNTGSWLNPFNHLKMPKLKTPFRKPKSVTPKVKKVKGGKVKRVKGKKGALKMPKLPKFGKDKKKSSLSNGASSVSPNYATVNSASFASMHDFMPMFVEETVHMPTVVKPPTNFAFGQSFPSMGNLGKPLHSMLPAESSIQPVIQKVKSRNQFNNAAAPMHAAASNMHFNVLNDYQVAASSFSANPFNEQQHPSTVARSVPTKAPSHLSYYYQNAARQAIPNAPKANQGAGSIESTLLADPFRPYRHSYGLPSVNIRYTYDKPQHNRPVTAAPTRAPKVLLQPKLTNKVVKIETTKFNFPGPGEIANEGNSADEQLESFLRDKFIQKLPQAAQPSAGNGGQSFRQRPTAAATPTTSKPRASLRVNVHSPHRRPTPSVAQQLPPSSFDLPARQSSGGSRKPQEAGSPPTNKFTSFTANADLFAREREKFFTNFNSQSASREPVVRAAKPSLPKLAPISPVKPAINYKLTPIAETAFEISNQSAAQPVQPLTHSSEAPNRDPVTNAVHKANRFEYTRSTQKPLIKYESYEWTTPTSLRNDKVRVNFNIMSPKDVTEEINSKKHLFRDDTLPYKPLDTPLNKPSFFPPIGDVFRHYQPPPTHKKATTATWASTEATPNQFLHELASSPGDDDLPVTTSAPWPNLTVEEENLAKLANDTNEYIMLMLSKMDPNDDNAYEANLRELLESSKSLAKVYNVESDAGNTLLALLPKFANEGTSAEHPANKPFVYKGESSLLRNLSQTDSTDSNVLKLDISKPDSEILHSIFDRVKDQLADTDQVLPSEEELGLFGIQSHQPRRIPSGAGNIISHPARLSTSTARPSTRESTSNIFNQPTGSTDQPWYEHFERDRVPHQKYPTAYEFHGENEPNQKLNRSSNAWYEDVSRKEQSRPVSVPHITEPIQPYSETPSSIRTTSSTPGRRYKKPTTTTTTTTTTSTTTTTTTTPAPTTITTTTTITTKAPSTSARPAKMTRRPNLRRKPEYGSRQGAQSRPPVESEVIREPTLLQAVPPVRTREPAPVRPVKMDAGAIGNQNSFGQKVSATGDTNVGKESYAEVGSTEKPIFYEEELPAFTELNYPETQNNHHPSGPRKVATSTTTASPETEPAHNNTYYPDSAVHNLKADKTGIPESACSRPGIFQHPNDCNKYYECFWDKHINKFTLQPFECPVKLAFDSRIIGCGSPNDPTVCVQY